MHLIIAFLILAACAVTDYFKRYFLSLPVVYHITMLLSIFVINNSALVLLNGMNIKWYVIVSCIANILSLVIYIRGHILPINENLDKYSAVPELYAAKRLIFTGILGVCLYTLLSAGVYCYSIYHAAQRRQYGYEYSEDHLALIIFGTLIFCILMSILAGLLITNGCIRYVRTTDKGGVKKNFRIFLTFVPVLNFFYGIVCVIKIKGCLKEARLRAA
ncbi:MAG: hypothetical protein K2H23_03660 [Oscillospiraceae bacterium]|nr:hypothetical protein [Oscillospiraceae bacterium]